MPLAIGSFLISRGQMTVGSLLAFINLLNNVTWPLGQLPNLYGSYKGALAGLGRIYEVIDLEAERQRGEAFAVDGQQVLCFDGVSFSYTDKEVLKDLSFTVTKGRQWRWLDPVVEESQRSSN